MEASVLHVWRLVIYHNQLLDSCQGAIAKFRRVVGHKYRVRGAGTRGRQACRHAEKPQAAPLWREPRGVLRKIQDLPTLGCVVLLGEHHHQEM